MAGPFSCGGGGQLWLLVPNNTYLDDKSILYDLWGWQKWILQPQIVLETTHDPYAYLLRFNDYSSLLTLTEVQPKHIPCTLEVV